MNLVFLCLLGIHLVYSVVTNARSTQDKKPQFSVILMATQSPMFALACYLAWRQGVFSRQLISPLYIGCGLAAGHLIFGLSVLATYRSWRAAAEMLGELGALWAYLVESPMVIARVLVVSTAEEVLYRAAAQPVMIDAIGNAAAGIAAVAVVFSLVHAHFFRNTVPVSVEFVGFSLLLGVLYYVTGSLVLVAVIHSVRNLEICFLEYTIKLEEHGDRERAASEIEEQFIPGSAENS